jgi:ferredoxin
MKNIIYTFSGTGNSLWTAKILGQVLGDSQIVPITAGKRSAEIENADTVGLVFPVHMWGVPGLVLDFFRELHMSPSTYLYAVAVNAGQVSRTLIQLQEEARKKGLTLAAGIGIILPSNYIPWGGPGNQENIQNRIDQAQKKVEAVAQRLRDRESWPVEQGSLWQRIVFTALYHLSFKQVPTMDKKFFIDDRCNGCGICGQVCPVDNIEMVEKAPVWRHKCTQCLACIQWCPQQAIQMSAKTKGYDRYHHPSIKLAEIISRNKSSFQA